MNEWRYPAIRIKQTSSEKRIVLFSANAIEVSEWSGVPQKKSFGDGAETTGFQREENPSRIESIRNFFSNPENLIQNPLLCATRKIEGSAVEFRPDTVAVDSSVEVGELVIKSQSFDQLPLVEVLEQLRESIELRLPEIPASISRLPNLRELAQQQGHSEFEDQDDGEAEEGEVNFESALFEESHLLDFWQEVAGRHQLLRELGDSFHGEGFLGFRRDALIGFLKPVVLVDGQHRLGGAIAAAEAALATEGVRGQIETAVAQGQTPEEVNQKFLHREARPLPISLLMSDDPEEQVFQFVVVNQKATPIGRALLGTIVSTTLSNDEMEKVADRLAAAGIQVEESRAITYLARNQDSPFFNLIERGLAGDSKDLLQWNVVGSLVSMFRYLKGGQLFGKKNDYADKWRRKHLSTSEIVTGFSEKEYESEYAYWSALNGPWREVFIEFFKEIKVRFGDVNDPDRPNSWGKTRSSNLFNKVSLTILAADFFQFLTDSKKSIKSSDAVSGLVDEWLDDVNLSYFDKNWELQGIKKDSTGIRNRWAELWSDYRENPVALPNKQSFRSPKKD